MNFNIFFDHVKTVFQTIGKFFLMVKWSTAYGSLTFLLKKNDSKRRFEIDIVSKSMKSLVSF